MFIPALDSPDELPTVQTIYGLPETLPSVIDCEQASVGAAYTSPWPVPEQFMASYISAPSVVPEQVYFLPSIQTLCSLLKYDPIELTRLCELHVVDDRYKSTENPDSEAGNPLKTSTSALSDWKELIAEQASTLTPLSDVRATKFEH
jgi:hypothetical protein